jgi:hypothetical protein
LVLKHTEGHFLAVLIARPLTAGAAVMLVRTITSNSSRRRSLRAADMRSLAAASHVGVEMPAIGYRRIGSGPMPVARADASPGRLRQAPHGRAVGDVPGNPRELTGAIGDARGEMRDRTGHAAVARRRTVPSCQSIWARNENIPPICRSARSPEVRSRPEPTPNRSAGSRQQFFRRVDPLSKERVEKSRLTYTVVKLVPFSKCPRSGALGRIGLSCRCRPPHIDANHSVMPQQGAAHGRKSKKFKPDGRGERRFARRTRYGTGPGRRRETKADHGSQLGRNPISPPQPLRGELVIVVELDAAENAARVR